MRTCGGGGYGPAAERDPRHVLQDVIEGMISPARAREAYQVAVDAKSRSIDTQATAQLRGRHAEEG
jgi:N-methylhydantoinase B